MTHHEKTFVDVLQSFTTAVETNDGDGLAALFTPDGKYYDGFYGVFEGRREISSMLREHFWGAAKDFRWHMYEPVWDGDTGYARYRFSYTSTLPDCEGKDVIFEGVSQFKFRDGLITEYREEFNTGMALVQLDFGSERVVGHLRKKVRELLGTEHDL